jgi:hypothetical protein
MVRKLQALLAKVNPWNGYSRSDLRRLPDRALLFPDDMPDDAYTVQTLSVVEDHANDRMVHVVISSLGRGLDDGESWGGYLANVANEIAYQYAEYLEASRDDGDLFAAICDGFHQEEQRLRQHQIKEAAE